MHTQAHSVTAADFAPQASPALPIDSVAHARSQEALLQDFRTLIGDGETLLKSMANLSGDALAQAREVFRGKLAEARLRAGELSGAALLRGRRAAVAADDYARDNPWLAIGIAVGVGLVVGALATRR